jgi:hypothetical protein
MADILPNRLAGHEAALLHALGFCATSLIHDDRLEMIVDMMRTALGKCPPRPQTEKLRGAAQSICDAYARRNQPAGAADWCLAGMKANAAAQEYHWAAFCAVAGV